MEKGGVQYHHPFLLDMNKHSTLVLIGLLLTLDIIVMFHPAAIIVKVFLAICALFFSCMMVGGLSTYFSQEEIDVRDIYREKLRTLQNKIRLQQEQLIEKEKIIMRQNETLRIGKEASASKTSQKRVERVGS